MKRRGSKKEHRAAKGRTHAGHHNIPIADLPQRSRSALNSSVHVVAAVRRDPTLSVTHAAKLEGVKLETVKKYVGRFLRKIRGRFRATKGDRLSVTLYVPDPYGNAVPIHTHSSKQREQASRYLRDLGRYLRGDRDALAAWHGKSIAGVELVTDARTIKAIEPALSDFSLYRTFTGGNL